MFSKNEKYLCYLYIIVFLILSYKVDSNTNVKIKILDYLNSLQHFSASFIQNDNETLSEGKVYIGEILLSISKKFRYIVWRLNISGDFIDTRRI